MAAQRTQHHLRVDIPPLPPSIDSKRLHTRLLAHLRAALSGPARSSVSVLPIRCSLLPSLGRPRSCLQTSLHSSALRGDLRLCRRALRVPQDARLRPCDVDPPPSSGDHHLPSPAPTHAGPTQAPHLSSPPSPQSPASPRLLPHGVLRPRRAQLVPHTLRRRRLTQCRLTLPPPHIPHCQAPPLQSLTLLVAGRSARRGDAREQRHRHGRKLAAMRDKEPEGAQPPNTAGGNTTRGETAHRGTPPANTHPTASPLQEEGRGARLAEVVEDPRTLRETKGTPHCWLM